MTVITCPRCNRPMGMRGVPSRMTHYCAFCGYTIIVTLGMTTSTAPLILKATLPRTWGEIPTKTIIPRVFYEAFEGDEVNEP